MTGPTTGRMASPPRSPATGTVLAASVPMCSAARFMAERRRREASSSPRCSRSNRISPARAYWPGGATAFVTRARRERASSVMERLSPITSSWASMRWMRSLAAAIVARSSSLRSRPEPPLAPAAASEIVRTSCSFESRSATRRSSIGSARATGMRGTSSAQRAVRAARGPGRSHAGRRRGGRRPERGDRALPRREAGRLAARSGEQDAAVIVAAATVPGKHPRHSLRAGPCATGTAPPRAGASGGASRGAGGLCRPRRGRRCRRARR